MKLRIVHSITYRYTEPVTLAPQRVLMRPREHHHASVLGFRLEVSPRAKIFWARDACENSLASVHVHERCQEFSLRATSEVETLDANPFDFLLVSEAARHPFHYPSAETTALAPFLEPPRGRSHPLLSWLRAIMPQFPDDTLALLTQLNRTLRDQIHLREELSPLVQQPEETIRTRSGTCRDFANLMMHGCRAIGLAARYVSGYRLDESGRSGLHAWTEVYLPGAGWKGFDASTSLLSDDHYVAVACAPGPDNLAPVTGAFWGAPGAASSMDSTVDVRRT